MRSTGRCLLRSWMRALRQVTFAGIVGAALASGQASAAFSDENDIDVRASKEGDVIVQSPANVNPTAGPAAIAINEDGLYNGVSLLTFASDADALPGDPPLGACHATG